MEKQKIESFILSNKKVFSPEQIPYITEVLQNVDDSKYLALSSADYKDPTITLVFSLLFGVLGVDRFYIGDVGYGVFKLLTAGGFGIAAIIDWFIISKKTRERNLAIFMETVNVGASFTGSSVVAQPSTSETSNTSDNIQKIKKYKELLDSGIITQEEFDQKKKELLR